MELVSIQPSTRKDKRFVANYLLDNGKYKNTHFGLKNPKYGTYIDHANDKRRKDYVARHLIMEKELIFNPITASALSMWILWGPYSDINKNIELFKKLFNV
jgi:hypothetical protein